MDLGLLMREPAPSIHADADLRIDTMWNQLFFGGEQPPNCHCVLRAFAT
jgi:hypothetical protein